MKKKKIEWNKIAFYISILILILLIIILNQKIDSNIEKMIEKKSVECAEKGYGIIAKYTKQGDKYYVCKVNE